MNLKSRVALITGSSQGIGKDIALSLLDAGAKVVITSRREKKLKELQNKLSIGNKEIYYVSGDSTKEDDVKRIISKTIKHFGRLDVLVNNVGGAIQHGDLFDLNSEDWIYTFQLNVMSMVYFTKHAHAWLKNSKSSRIINISSVSGIEPGLYNPHYAITKAATINFTKYTANKFAKDNILVNVICPGIMDGDSRSDFMKDFSKKNNVNIEKIKEKLNKIDKNKIPLGVLGRGQDIGSMVVFLASDKASWITGSCLKVDGGKLSSII